MSTTQSEDDHITLMDGLARGLTVYKACLQLNERIFDKDNYDVVTVDIIHQEIDRYVNELWDFEIMSILYNFGLDKAIEIYKDNFGEVTTSRALVFALIEEQLPKTEGYVYDEEVDESIKEVVDYLLEKQSPLTDDEKAAELAEREDY
jgi:hypothetical protein